MGGSLEWVMCPVCGYDSACLDFELRDKTTKLYCSSCGYDSVRDGPVYRFLYRKEFRIVVLASSEESARERILNGEYLNLYLLVEAGLHSSFLELEEDLYSEKLLTVISNGFAN